MIRIVSFGYKHGNPPKALAMIDCRSLPNPHKLAHLRERTGLDEAVRDHVRSGSDFMALVDHAVGYACHGDGITLAFGCVGGRHRSVAAAEETGDRLRKMGYEVDVIHSELRSRLPELPKLLRAAGRF
jgi:RNase adapter protein RapZ